MNTAAPQNKTTTIIIVALTFFVSFFATRYFFSASKDSFDKELVKVANEINKTCPLVVDESTRLDNVMALPDKTLQYNFTLVDLYKVDVNLDTVKKYVFPKVLENAKTNPDVKIMRDNKTTFNYYYTDKMGKFVCKYTVTPEMYQ